MGNTIQREQDTYLNEKGLRLAELLQVPNMEKGVSVSRSSVGRILFRYIVKNDLIDVHNDYRFYPDKNLRDLFDNVIFIKNPQMSGKDCNVWYCSWLNDIVANCVFTNINLSH